MIAVVECLKRARVRRPDGSLYILCGCSAEPVAPPEGETVRCAQCQAVYDHAGYILSRPVASRAAIYATLTDGAAL